MNLQNYFNNKKLTFEQIKTEVINLELEPFVIFDSDEAFFEAINEDEDCVIELPWPIDWPEYINGDFLDKINVQWTVA